jgi:hypothetical protein
MFLLIESIINNNVIFKIQDHQPLSDCLSQGKLISHRRAARYSSIHSGRLGNVQIKGHQLLPIDMPYHYQFKLCQEQLEKIKNIEVELHAQGYGLSKLQYSK